MSRHRRLAIVIAAVVGCAFNPAQAQEAAAESGTPPAAVTFNRDIAPIVFEHCASCHRPGESAPFPLLEYTQVRSRARQVAEVTGSGYMPPWLPEAGYADFRGERRLTEEQIALIQLWAVTGAAQGDPADLPPRPEWSTGWQLGEPDLVVQMTQPYTLPADAVDVFRNFVIPLTVDTPKWIKTVEVRPGNPRIVHHGVMRIDRTRSSQLLADREPEMGFGSMNMGDAVVPDGHSIDWTPGMQPYPGTEGLAWKLGPGTDAVLQLHMLPTGRPETIQPILGLHYADAEPEKHLFGMMLRARDIDIPAGEKNYVTTDSYVVPIDIEVLSVYPHAHYLGKRIEAYATLPDGEQVPLIHIPDWDFRWQDTYVFREPVRLPKGTLIEALFRFDNSATNPFNPSSPPQRVKEGWQTTDEMCLFYFSLVPDDPEQTGAITRAAFQSFLRPSNP